MCGVVNYERRKFPESESMMRRILEMAPDHYDVECRLADTLYAMSEQNEDCPFLKQAKLIYESVYARKPNYSYAINGVALFVEDEERRKLLETAIELDSTNCYALTNLGGYYLNSVGLVLDAAFLFERALEINPNLFYTRTNLTVAFLRLGRINDALVRINEQIVMRPNDKQALALRESIMTHQIIAQVAVLYNDERIEI